MVEIAFARYPALEGKRGMPLRRDFTAIGGTHAPLRHIGVARHELTIDLVLCAARALGFCLVLRVNTTRAAWARLPFKSLILHLKAFRVYDH
jgi:hypothetical protein